MSEPTPSPEADDIAMIAALQAEAGSPFGQSPTIGVLLDRHPARIRPVRAALFVAVSRAHKRARVSELKDGYEPGNAV